VFDESPVSVIRIQTLPRPVTKPKDTGMARWKKLAQLTDSPTVWYCNPPEIQDSDNKKLASR